MKRNKTAFLLLAGLAAAMMIGCGGSTSDVDLKLNLQQGKTYKTRVTTDQVINHTVNGQTTSINQKTTQDFTCEVQDIDQQGNINLRVTFERIMEETARGTVRQSYDSGNPDDQDSMTAKKYVPFVGHGINLIVTDRGEMVGASGIDSLVNRIIDVLEIREDTLREQMRTLMQGQYGQMMAAEICDKLFGALPGVPVKAGNTWSRTTEGKVMIPLTWENSMTLKSVGDGVAVVVDTATTRVEAGDEPEDMGPVKISREAEGTMSGTLEIETATGLISGGTLTAEIKGQQIIVEGPERVKGQSIPLDVVQTMSWQRL